MTTLNLTPVLDALGGTAATPAVFKAEARRAGRRATRVNGAEVAFATELIAVWDGTAWNTPPTLYSLPVDCYWNVKVQASGNRLELNGILPDGRDAIDFGELIAITPDTGTPDTTAVAQYQATQRFVSNQVAHIDAVNATIFGTVATVQAQIETAASQIATAEAALAGLTDTIAAAEAAAASAAADRAAAETILAAIRAEVAALNQLSAVDIGSGELALTGTGVIDNGDGTLNLTAVNVVAAGDGTVTF